MQTLVTHTCHRTKILHTNKNKADEIVWTRSSTRSIIR